MRLLGDDGYPFVFATEDHLSWQVPGQTMWLAVGEAVNERVSLLLTDKVQRQTDILGVIEIELRYDE